MRNWGSSSINGNGECQVVSVVSGKDGTGKTTLAIALSALLCDVGFRVLLIDCNFSNRSASRYFLEPDAEGGTPPVGSPQDDGGGRAIEAPVDAYRVLLPVREGLDVIPVSVDRDDSSMVSFTVERESFEGTLRSFIEGYRKEYDFIILDNQAGVNFTSEIATGLSTKAVIVSELDPASSDAVRLLLESHGDALPEYTRHLINKLDHRKREDYGDISRLVFSGVRRLPPLPLDYAVSMSFKKRQLTSDSRELTAFDYALFKTVSALFPEHRERFKKHEEALNERYIEYLDRINEKMDDTYSQVVEQAVDAEYRDSYKGVGIASIILFILFGLAITWVFLTYFLSSTICTILLVVFYFILAIAIGGAASVIASPERYSSDMRKALAESDTKFAKYATEFDSYQSLLMTEDMEFLLRFEREPSEKRVEADV